MTASTSRRLLPLYSTVFMQSFVLWYAIEKPFMKSIGFNDATIALATIAFTAVLMVANIPLGILADRWSRKKILILSSLFLSLSSVVCGLSGDPVLYTLGLCVWAIYLACFTGAFDSIVYDVIVEETGSSENFEKMYGRAELYNTGAYIGGALLGGVIASWLDFREVYLISAIVAFSSVVPLLYFREPTLHKTGSSEFVKDHIRDILKVLMSSKGLPVLVAITVLVSVGLRLLLEFGPLWLVALSLPIAFYGPAASLNYLAMGLCGFLADWVKNKRNRIFGLVVAICLLSTLLALRSLSIIVVATSLLLLCIMALSIILSRYLHDTVSSNIRAGVSSVVSTIGYAVFLPVAFVFGQLSHMFSIFSAAFVVVAITLVVVVLINPVTNRHLRTVQNQ